MIHAARKPLSGTSRWLNARAVAMHHHLVAEDSAGYDRLARFVSGNARGFVACGGGALCAAHVGVYKAFLEANIGFDVFGGTSGGGAMAAAFAMGASPDEVSTRTAAIFLEARALKRLTWPRYSLLDHTVFDRALKTHYGDAEIEDLWNGYFAVLPALPATLSFSHYARTGVEGGVGDELDPRAFASRLLRGWPRPGRRLAARQRSGEIHARAEERA